MNFKSTINQKCSFTPFLYNFTIYKLKTLENREDPYPKVNLVEKSSQSIKGIKSRDPDSSLILIDCKFKIHSNHVFWYICYICWKFTHLIIWWWTNSSIPLCLFFVFLCKSRKIFSELENVYYSIYHSRSEWFSWIELNRDISHIFHIFRCNNRMTAQST